MRQKIQPFIFMTIGKKQSGKDTFYQALKSSPYSAYIERVAFADSLKEECFEKIFKPMGIYQTLEESLLEDNKIKHRKILQVYGTDICRNTADSVEDLTHLLAATISEVFPEIVIDLLKLGELISELDRSDDYWINRALPKIKDFLNQGKIVVVTDVRFINEHDKINELGFPTYGINITSNRVSDDDNHSSEQNFQFFYSHYTISNNGTLQTYIRNCLDCLSFYLDKNSLNFARDQVEKYLGEKV